jgi:NAD(P)-dependent dehydrogenase (short-subunit alcohol dehydrogenase family)
MSKKKTAIVTGASRGIGHAISRLFLAKGWQIITCSRSEIPDTCGRDKNWCHHFPADLSNPESIKKFIDQVSNAIEGGTLNALINNAGMSPKTNYKERLGCLNGDIEAWREVFELNFYAPLKLSRGFASFLHQGRGSVVNITSIAGHKIHPFAGSAYSISKAALSSLTREMANEFASLNVRVNAIAPGEIKTGMIQPEYEVLIPRIPLDHLGSPDDVAQAAFYLCSEEAKYITGTEIWVTGGQHMF